MAYNSLYNVCRDTPHRWIGHGSDNKYSTTLDLTLSKMLYSKLSLWQSWMSVVDIASPRREREENCSILCLSYSTDGKFLFAGSNNRNVHIFNPNTGKEIRSINQAHNGAVNCICYVGNNQFVSGSEDSTIALWDIRKSTAAVNVLQGHSSCVRELMYNEHGGGILLSSSIDNDIRYWHLPSFQSANEALIADNDENEQYRGVLMNCPSLSHFSVSPNNEWLTVVNLQGTIYVVYNLDVMRLCKTMKVMRLDEGLVMQLAWFNPNCSLSKKNRIRVLASDEYTPPGQGVVNKVRGIHFHPQHCFLMMRVGASHTFGLKSTEWSCGVNLQQQQSSFDKSWLTINSFGSEVMEETLMYARPEEKSGFMDKKYSFSSCGRLFSSPGKSHVSLLAFCDELKDPFTCVKKRSEPFTSMLMGSGSATTLHKSLTEVATIKVDGQVSCAKLSATDMILTVGDKEGHLNFYQPRI